jgi:plasmid segregation protein ParM
MSSIVRAVDVGFGNTKFVLSHIPGAGIRCGVFPSLCAVAGAVDVSSGFFARRDTVTVQVDGNTYECGPDVRLALGTHTSRCLHKNFVDTAEYIALMRTALSYVNQPSLGLLAVGLPVSLLHSKSAVLRQRLEGTHEVADGKVVEISKVLVLAQPIGGFIDYALGHGLYRQFRQQTNLIIDPGFFTVDWVVARGLQPVPRRCGSFAGGMHTVLRHLSHAVSDDFQVDLDDLTLMDEALRTGSLNLFGKTIAIEKYLSSARPVIDEAVNAVVNSVGDGRDVDNVVIVGGGAQFYRESICRRFPSHSVTLASEPAFANVRGFQLAGEEVARRQVAEVA